MNQPSTSTITATNGESTVHDLFALTDEQILEIEPETQDVEHSTTRQPARTQDSSQVAPASLPAGSPSAPQNGESRLEASTTRAYASNSAEPPPWLAAQMKDPWNGEEAKELWNGVQQAKSEAAAYRADVCISRRCPRAEGVVSGRRQRSRAPAAERARVLDDIDRAYFGTAGKSAQEVSASREQLAQQMLREDPAAFREMVFAGLRALEASGAQADSGASVGSRFSATSATGDTAAQTASNATQNRGGLKSAPTNAPAHASTETQATEHDARMAAYASFEKAANEDLERSVGSAIERTLAQALPNASRVATLPA